MKDIDLNTWNRKALFDHFMGLKDPYFGVTIPFDVSVAYKWAKANSKSFFAVYLHDCMTALNSVENLKFRIVDEKVVCYDTIHASATIMRADKTFGFSFIEYAEQLNDFILNLESEKNRIENSKDLYPPVNSLDCIHCSAIPWLNFSGHKEPASGLLESVPKLAFSKIVEQNGKLMMNVAISVNHALADGYHIGLFSEKFQSVLNEKF